MAKEVSKVVKLQVRGGQANPSPPVGPALGAAGVLIAVAEEIAESPAEL